MNDGVFVACREFAVAVLLEPALKDAIEGRELGKWGSTVDYQNRVCEYRRDHHYDDKRASTFACPPGVPLLEFESMMICVGKYVHQTAVNKADTATSSKPAAEIAKCKMRIVYFQPLNSVPGSSCV